MANRARMKNETKQNKEKLTQSDMNVLCREIATLWNSTWKKENLVLFNKINVLSVFEWRGEEIATAKVTKNWKAKQKNGSLEHVCLECIYYVMWTRHWKKTQQKKKTTNKTTTKNRFFIFHFPTKNPHTQWAIWEVFSIFRK